MSDERNEAFTRIAGKDRKKTRALAERQGFTVFARDGITPLPTLTTTEKDMKPNLKWIAALLAFKSEEVKEEKD